MQRYPEMKEKLVFDEPKVFGIARFRLWYSIISILGVVGLMIFGNENYPVICFGLVAMFAIYLFLPFTYKLIVSDEAISSINLWGAQTLAWNEVAEIRPKNENFLLSNRDGDVKVFVNQQIDGYPEVINFIKRRRADLWQSDETSTFHQSIVEATISGIVGLIIIYAITTEVLKNDISPDQVMPLLFFGLMAAVLLWQTVKIREIAFDREYLIAKYIVGERQIHVSEIKSVGLEQKMGKNEISYPVHIQLRNGKRLVLEKVQEGNSMLVNTIENWMNKHKGKQNDRA